ncbi:MAG TPA: carboxypeptidase-like regulatory domain-containing protein, partial [Candidatus Acidoferrales bacterium]|nr:carboxypeptidase-like regulatory domain-containing protein [Candidatus Acidoferrales bacterium]
MIGALGLWTTGQDQNTGTLRGVVEDPSGDPVPGAQVELQNKTTHDHFETASDETGRFGFVNLLSGEYTITVRVAGFRDAQVSVSVAAASAGPLHVRLGLAEVKNEVTVSANSFTAPSAEQNNDVVELTGPRLQSLPTSGDLLAVPSLFLDPGALGVGGAKIIVDGVESSALEVPMSSVKRVYVNKSPYSSEYGRPGKGRIEVITRRGVLEKHHGDLSLLARSSNASPLRWRTIAEALLSGPLAWKNKEDGPLYGNHAGGLSEKATFLLSGRSSISNEGHEVNAVTRAGRLKEKFPAPERDTYVFGLLDFRPNVGHRLALHYRYKNKLQREQGVEGVNLPERGTNFFDHEHEVKALDVATLSPTLLNEIRFSFRKQSQQTSSVVDQTANLVLDTFNAGGAQVSLRRRETALDLQDLVTLIKGRHSFRFGGGIRPRFYRVRDASNFGG